METEPTSVSLPYTTQSTPLVDKKSNAGQLQGLAARPRPRPAIYGYGCLTCPRSRNTGAADVETGSEFLKNRRRQAFGEYISVLRGCGQMQNSNITNSNTITDEVEINLNVLDVLMLDWIAGHINCANVITVDQSGTMQRIVKLLKELVQPGGFGNSICHGVVLSFCTGSRYSGLALG